MDNLFIGPPFEASEDTIMEKLKVIRYLISELTDFLDENGIPYEKITIVKDGVVLTLNLTDYGK